MPQWSIILIATVAFAILAPIIGCLLAGVDRKLSARLQGRVGPSMLQPYYDMRKLLEKDDVSVNTTEGVYVTCALIFAIVAGGIFYGGGNLLLCVFIITLASLFFIVAAYSTRSPYAEVGANRETVQVMSYEPMV
ncbi:MAG: NADH-quinone oxidoreductase subunit H, partial [Eggerthellaceae bacterium]|nr:NADH-quinone oxidoreductase subunit H [Eggerthellaceae bacterium]